MIDLIEVIKDYTGNMIYGTTCKGVEACLEFGL